MKKEVIILISIIILLSFYYINTDNFLNSITGMAVSQGIKLNITYQNSAPVIYNVTNPGGQSITEAGVTNVTFWFRVNEPDGISDLVNASSYGELNKTGEVRRINSSCAFSNEINATVAEYQCRVVGLWWFDASGTWSVNASVRDSAGNIVTNLTQIFTVTSTTAFSLGPTAINWGDIMNSSVNVTPTDDPVLINNTGNSEAGEYGILTKNLMGETNSSQFINVENFTVDVDSGGSPPLECGVNATSGRYLQNESWAQGNIPGSNNSRGNFTINCETSSCGQEQFYFCINFITSNASSGQADLSEQSYSAHTSRAWGWTTI